MKFYIEKRNSGLLIWAHVYFLHLILRVRRLNPTILSKEDLGTFPFIWIQSVFYELNTSQKNRVQLMRILETTVQPRRSNFRIPRNSFTCHWIRIASIVLCLDLQSLRLACPINSLHPNIRMHILLDLPHTFHLVLTWRICLTIESWWLVIISSILMILMKDSAVLVYGEIRQGSLLRFKGLTL